MRIPILAAVAAASAILAGTGPASTPARARAGQWGTDGGSRWDRRTDDPLVSRTAHTRQTDSREGRIEVSRFIGDGDAASRLGHGAVAVTSQDGSTGTSPIEVGTPDYLSGHARAPYEAAVVDRLVSIGYDTAGRDPAGGQLAELHVTRDILVPAEPKRSPVSGSAAMEVGSRGSAYGLAVNVDMTKPRTALVSTRLEARIRDRVSGKVLWEGRAEIATREGDDKWTDGAIASRLAEALFDDFTVPAGDGLRRG